ncbi:hypothetical protein [Streptomyces olivochromogenes]|uniref:hypothetical protein n=1 Tax=Streptomyces olivochromogenes TaxID=1963 RepID=UPI00368086DA
MSSTGLEGRGVVVTGAGSGIGRAAALESGGVDVLVHNAGVLDRLSAGAARTAAEHGDVGTKAHGPRVIGNGAVLPVDHGWSAV